jgi:hypothetical protein
MFLPSLVEQNVPSVLGGTVSRDSAGGCVSVVPIGPRVVRWYKAATGDGWIVIPKFVVCIIKERAL